MKVIVVLLSIIFSIYSQDPLSALYERHAKYSHHQSSLKKVIFPSQHTTAEGVVTSFEREGVLLERPEAPGTIFICHGFMCNKFDCGFLRLFFPNFNIFTFDFRAHGNKVDDNQ